MGQVKMRRRNRRLPAMLVALACAASAAPPVLGQIDLGVQARQDPKQMMADQLALLMQDALAGGEMPTADQLSRAQVLLDLALGLAPDRVELWRMQRDLAELRGDEETVQESLGRIVRVDPQDDAAQLALILNRVADAQTLNARMEMVERVLDTPAGKSLSPALRSRLASFAASASQELGDDRKFARRLTEALRLDSSNGEAARLAYGLAVERGDSPLYRGIAAMTWVKAEPTNPEAREVLARLLLEEGVYEQAAQQFDMSLALARTSPAPEQLQAWVMSLAMAGQTESAMTVLSQMERSVAPAEGGAATEPATQPLPPSLELVRLAALSVDSQPETTRQYFERLQRSLGPLIEAGDEAARRELAIAAAMFGHDLESAEAILGDAPADDPTRSLVRGWVALRYGRLDEGRQHLQPLAEAHPLAALGMALLESDADAKASMLETIRKRDPQGIPALLAVLNLRKLGREPAATKYGMSLRDAMEQTPARLWHADLSVSPWMGMRLTVEPGRLSYLEPVRGTAILQNLSGVPLSVGEGATLPPRMLVSVQPSRAGEPLQPMPPMIVDLGRRLSVNPSERYLVEFRLDHSAIGEMLAMNPIEPVTFGVTAIVDPQPTPQGGVRPGPAGALDSVRAISLVNQPVTSENVQAWIAALDSQDRAEQFRAIARLLRVISAPLPAEAGGAATTTQIGEAIAQRFRNYDAVQQAWVMRFLPSEDGQLPVALQRVVEQAQRSNDPLIRLVYLSTHVKDPESPAMNAALRTEDPLIGEFARALRDTLRRQAEQPQSSETQQPSPPPSDPATTPPPPASPEAP